MAKQLPPDELPLSPRCLGIVFKERKPKKDQSPKSDSVEPPDKQKGGFDLFNDFIEENKRCYWDPHLEESVKNLKYEGHLHPYTILVAGRDIYLDTVKNAWSRRAVQSLPGFSIYRVGEVSDILMTPIPQTQFSPLPEALCITISDLTKTQKDASFDAIMDRLKVVYRGLQQPTELMTYETLGTLIKERKIYHTGSGYHILTPDLFQPGSNSVSVQDHHLVIGGTGTTNGITPTLYIPLVNSTNQADTRTISCQTETKTTDSETNSRENDCKTDEEDKSRGKLERNFSFKEKKNKKDHKDAFSRSSSLRYGDDKAKNVVKDINLKTSDAHREKDKGEKSSLLSKLFSRNKTKDSSPGKEETATEKAETVEFATFSAQFPPPEWGWYEGQIKTDVPPVADVRLVPHSGARQANTWHHMSPPRMLDGETQSDDLYDEIHVHANDCPVTRSRTLPAELSLQHQKLSSPVKSMSSLSGSWSSLSDHPIKSPHQYLDSSHSGHQNSHSVERHRSHDGTNQDIPSGQARDVRPKEMNNANHDSLRSGEMNHFRNTFENPVLLNNNIAMSPPDRPTHVTKVFKKYREMKCATFCTNDISVEYCGKMPRKGAGISMSRDSGVNCIGQVKNTGMPQLYAKNHYNTNIGMVSNVEPRPSPSVHQVQIHQHPGATPEDSGFNSLRVADLHDPVDQVHDSYDQVPYSSTPNNLSPSQQYEESEEPLHLNQLVSGARKISTSRNQSQSPDRLNCEDRYPAHDMSNGHMEYPDIGGYMHQSQHQGSGTSLWSDTSKQTVKEIRPQSLLRSQNEPHLRQHSSSPSGRPKRSERSPHRKISQSSKESQILAENIHTSNQMRAKPHRKSSRDEHSKSKSSSRPSSGPCKSLSNHVYESHQKKQARTKCPVVEQPRDYRD